MRIYIVIACLDAGACHKNDIVPNKPGVKNGYYLEIDNLYVHFVKNWLKRKLITD